MNTLMSNTVIDLIPRETRTCTGSFGILPEGKHGRHGKVELSDFNSKMLI